MIKVNSTYIRTHNVFQCSRVTTLLPRPLNGDPEAEKVLASSLVLVAWGSLSRMEWIRGIDSPAADAGRVGGVVDVDMTSILCLPLCHSKDISMIRSTWFVWTHTHVLK